MKRKFMIILIVSLTCSMPVHLTGQLPDNFIKIRIQIDEGSESVDSLVNDLTKGYLLQAFRQIPNVTVVNNDELYLIRILVSKTENFYTVMYIVTDTLPISEISLFIPPDTAKIVEKWINLGSPACKIETYGFFTVSLQTLEERCKNFVVSLDASLFQSLRENFNKILQEHSSGNP